MYSTDKSPQIRDHPYSRSRFLLSTKKILFWYTQRHFSGIAKQKKKEGKGKVLKADYFKRKEMERERERGCEKGRKKESVFRIDQFIICDKGLCVR